MELFLLLLVVLFAFVLVKLRLDKRKKIDDEYRKLLRPYEGLPEYEAWYSLTSYGVKYLFLWKGEGVETIGFHQEGSRGKWVWFDGLWIENHYRKQLASMIEVLEAIQDVGGYMATSIKNPLVRVYCDNKIMVK